MGEKPSQPGFYISSDGKEFHRSPKKGDRMVREKETRKPRKKCYPTLWEETTQFLKEKIKRDEQQGVWVGESLDGGLAIIDTEHGGASYVGEYDPNFDGTNSKWTPPPRRILPKLSDPAKKLLWVRQHQSRFKK